MDLYDQAQELDMLQRDASIAQARQAPTGSPAYTGHCAFCAVSLPSPKRFCDADCRDGWERENAARKRNGLPILDDEEDASEGSE